MKKTAKKKPLSLADLDPEAAAFVEANNLPASKPPKAPGWARETPAEPEGFKYDLCISHDGEVLESVVTTRDEYNALKELLACMRLRQEEGQICDRGDVFDHLEDALKGAPP